MNTPTISATGTAHKTYYLHLPVENSKIYKTRQQASTASCLFINSGQDKVNPSDLKLYRRYIEFLKNVNVLSDSRISPISGRVVGNEHSHILDMNQ